MSRRRMALIGSAVIFVVLTAWFAPFTLMLVPNPRPVAIRGSVEIQAPGNYITSGSVTYHVFPHAERVAVFPEDSLVTSARPTLWVRYRQLSDVGSYTVRRFADDTLVPAERHVQAKVLRIEPRDPLEPGNYYLTVARESIYGGTDYVYFSVADIPDVQPQSDAPIYLTSE